VNANVTYTDENLFTQSIATPDDNTYLDARTLVNANITLKPRDDRYFVRLIGRNLTDQTYKSASQVVGGLWAFTIYGPPRYFGLEAGMKFGK
ncbi:MAG: TonB-dependent receptor, partial [Gammaproteobacteria bacterium]